MAGVNLAKAWDQKDNAFRATRMQNEVAHMTFSEAKQRYDPAALRRLDPAAYHDIEVLKHEGAMRDYIAGVQQRQVVGEEYSEAHALEIMRDMISTNNQVAYHDFADRINATEFAIDHMEHRHHSAIARARHNYERLRDNGLPGEDGHHYFLSKDGKGGVDENLNPLTPEQLALAQRERESHPDATTSEQYTASIATFRQSVIDGAHIQQYRQELTNLRRTAKPVEGEPHYAQRMEDYNRQWADMLKHLPEEDRAIVFKHDAKAAALYAQYQDQASALRLDSDVGATAQTAAVKPGAAADKPVGVSGNFNQCTLGALNGKLSEDKCYAYVPGDGAKRPSDKGPSDTLTSSFNAQSGPLAALIQPPAAIQPAASAAADPATIAAMKPVDQPGPAPARLAM